MGGHLIKPTVARQSEIWKSGCESRFILPAQVGCVFRSIRTGSTRKIPTLGMRVRIVLRLRSGTGDLLLAHVAEDLVTVLFAVGSAADMDPVVATVGGLHNQLVKVSVMF